MQVLTTRCPYCKQDVDTTIDHLDGPVVCPACHKPFEMRMPTATVSAVHDVEDDESNHSRMAGEPDERTLLSVHPVVFRARPFGTILASLALLAGLAGLILPLLGWALFGSNQLGPLTLLTWLSLIVIVAAIGFMVYWIMLSQFTTLTITDDRTIYREGIISRDTSEVQHDDVRNIQVDQSFIERLLGVGAIGISSSGQDDLEVVARRMPNPEKIVQTVRENQH